MQELLELSIVIVNWNVRELLKDCLESVLKQVQCSPDQYEIIVVDNASEDGSVEMIRETFPTIRLIEETENLGFGKGCNEGFNISRGKFVLMLNPDTVVTGPDIDLMLGLMKQDPSLGIVGPRMVDQFGTFRRDAGGGFPTLWNVACHFLLLNRVIPKRLQPQPHFLDNDPQGTFDIDWVCGAGLMLRRTTIKSTVFAEDFFMFGEDMELCDRICRQGKRVVYTSDATIIHHHGQSFEKQQSFKVLKMVYTGPRLYFQKKHNRLETSLYDLIMLFGYLMRWLFFSVALLIRKDDSDLKYAQFSRQYVSIMISLLVKKNNNQDQ